MLDKATKALYARMNSDDERQQLDVMYSQCLPGGKAEAKALILKCNRNAKKAACSREYDATMRDLGLVKVRGAISGRIYWE